MPLSVSESLSLTEFQRSDIPALCQFLVDEDIYRSLLRVPRPYTQADAEKWLSLVEEDKSQGRPVLKWAIRERDQLIGGIGLEIAASQPHRAELGYWLAKPFWNRGIMTAVIPVLCRHSFETLGLAKVTANVFSFNLSSARVLEKCGFEREGFLRRHYLKDGQFIDSIAFGRLRG